MITGESELYRDGSCVQTDAEQGDSKQTEKNPRIKNLIQGPVENTHMHVNLRIGILLCLLLIAGVLIAGCSDQSDNSAATAVPTTTIPQALYSAGDIIAKTSSGGSQLYVITGYDAKTDQYERAWIYQNSDGSWGHFIDSRTDTSDRAIVEKVYPVKIAHITLSSIPVITPTPVVIANVTYVGQGPSVDNITPSSAAQDATVTVTITGSNFQTGAIPKLLQPGSAAITGSAVSVSTTTITATFDLSQKDSGDYNVLVINPDGRSDTLQNAFTIGNAAPVIYSITPNSAEMGDMIDSFTISGQNFKTTGVKVTLIQGATIFDCSSADVIDATKVTCGPVSFKTSNGAVVGAWDVRVLNIEGGQSGTLSQKFTLANATSTSSS